MKKLLKLALVSTLLVSSLSALALESTVGTSVYGTASSINASAVVGVVTLEISVRIAAPTVVVSAYTYVGSAMTSESSKMMIQLAPAEFLAVKDDGVNFLANDEMSESLENFLTDLKTQNPGLERATDRDIVSSLLTADI